MSNNPNYNPIGGNGLYRKVRSFGTPSALDPSQIQQASTLDVPNPIQVIDVTVSVPVGIAFTSPAVFNLGAPLPVGAVVLSASLNGNQTVLPGNTNTYALGLVLTAGGSTLVTTLFASHTAVFPGISVPSPVGTSINGSEVVFPNAIVTSAATYPVLVVMLASTGELSGEINCKISYYLP